MPLTMRTLVAILLIAPALAAQSVEDRLRQLEAAHQAALDEHRSIAERLAEAERRNAELENRLGTLSGEESAIRERELESQINAITASAQGSNFIPATKSGTPIRFYGFIRVEGYYNSRRSNDPILTFRAARGTEEERDNDNQFAFDPRLTRFGFDLDFGEIGSAKVAGKFEIDFANFPTGSPESRATPRLRLAYVDMTWDEFTLRVGQDWDVISPLIPSVNGEFLLWGAGNLGDRRAQIQGLWNSSDKTEQGLSTFFLEAGLGVTGAIDSLDLDGTGGGRTFIDGFDSGHPHGQLRVGTSYDTWVDKKSGTLGIWGYVAALETDTQVGGEDRFIPFAIGLDFVQPLTEALSLRLEAWYGQALSDIRGNILQAVNTATGEEIAGYGGWAELEWRLNETFSLIGGGSIDNPDDGDLRAAANQDRALNWTAYGQVKADWGKGLTTGLEAIYYSTEFEDDEEGDLVRLALWMQLVF